MKIEVWLMISLKIFSLPCFIGPTSAFIFFPVHRLYVPPMNLDAAEEKNEENHVASFSPLFSIFRHRNFDPFLPFWNGEQTDTSQNATTMQSDDSQKMKTNNTSTEKINITVASGSESLTSPVPEHLKPLESRTRRDEDTGFQLKFHPFIHSRVFRFRRIYPDPLKDKSNDDEKEHKENVILTEQSKVGDTGKLEKDSEVKFGANCTNHFYSRYFFMWNVKWASLGVHLATILLLSGFITFAILFCHPNCLLKSGLKKTKPLQV